MNEAIPNAGIGHNEPPENANPIIDRLNEKYEPQVSRKDELLEALERAPDEITDDKTAGDMAVFIKQCGEAVKEAKGIHKDEKQPYLDNGRSVDSFFKTVWEPLLDVKATLEHRLGAYQKKKADAERIKREAEENKARLEAEEAERKALEAKEKVREDGGLTAAIEADDAAKDAAEAAATAERAADAPAKDMGRIHSDTGVTASHKGKWVGKIVDLPNLDLAALRPYIKFSELERAVNEYAKKTNGAALAGAEMKEKFTTRVR